MDELVRLSEREAARSALDTLNCRILFRLLVPCVFISIVTALALLTRRGGTDALIAVPLIALVLIRGLYLIRERPFFTSYFRPILLGWLIFQLLAWRFMAWAWPPEPGSSTPPAEAALLSPFDLLLPLAVLFFRLRTGQLSLVLGILWLVSAGRHLLAVLLGSTAPDPPLLVAQTFILGIVFLVSRSLTRRRRSAFLEVWRREHRRDQDRRRMQGELDDARRFQLAMLPHRDPAIPGLDLSGLSIPASEVGGDYYGYFPMDEGPMDEGPMDEGPVDEGPSDRPGRESAQVSRCGIVVADVSGHGVASGLLLSGVRSCLHLLQETPMESVEVLGRLDRMLRRIAQKRAFVTMVHTVWDDRTRRLEIASAGHPPVLCFRAASGEVEEIDLPALPLGTPIPGRFEQISVELHPGDVFMLYTDGIAETMNVFQNLYGDERLRQALSRAARDPERTAKQIRDAVLSNLWSFKADGVQHDDVTLVVGRVIA